MMQKRKLSILILACFLAFSGCAGLIGPAGPTGEMKQMALDQAVYEPYEKENTIKGYEEFILKYPPNYFVSTARRKIDDLRFLEAERINTRAGYGEFIRKYPSSQNLPRARLGIEKIEFAYCKKENISTCYEDFLARYRESMFKDEAKENLQELNMKKFARELGDAYGFDLLLYNLNLNRTKSGLVMEGKRDLGDFSFLVLFVTREGKQYLQTRLTFHNDAILSLKSPGGIAQEFFDTIIAGQLEYLDFKFKGKEKIAGFSFKAVSFPFGVYEKTELFECYFPLDEVDQFVKGKMDQETLMKKAIIVPDSAGQPPAKVAEPETAQQNDALQKPREVSEPVPLAWHSEADGLARNGKFVRTAPPACSFEFPGNWVAEIRGDTYVFQGKDPSGFPVMQVMIARIVGDEAEFLKSLPTMITDLLRRKGGSNVKVLYSTSTDVYEDFSAWEFEINYRPKRGKPTPRLTSYVNAIAKEGYAIILAGESRGDIDQLKMIYETLKLKPWREAGGNSVTISK